MSSERRSVDKSSYEQREHVRAAARSARLNAKQLVDSTNERLRQARRMAQLAAQPNTGGRAGRDRFTALPVAAALLDSTGRVREANPEWAALPFGDRFRAGVLFGSGWTALTGDPAVEHAVGDAGPVQAEATVPEDPPLRFLVQIGPAALADGPGYLVVLVDITRMYERETRLMFDATHDPLTGVANRAWLAEEVRGSLDRLRRYGELFALIYLDLERFKAVNDRHGHAAGDEVLRAVTDRWQHLVRAPDLLARVGGDEFVVVVHHVSAPTAASALAARLSAALQAPVIAGTAALTVAVSVGVVVPPAAATVEDAIALADREMYRHKRAAPAS